MNNRKLVLENGIVFEGIGFGSLKETVAEMIFYTSVVGYQEILSDPSNCDKMICMTYPLIGNYGMTDEDYESKYIKAKALVVREYNEFPSNFRYTKTLDEVMEENDVCGISGIDTRYLMKLIKQYNNIKALICDIDKPIDECLELIKNYKESANLVSLVSSKKIWFSRTPNPIYNIAFIDLGTKINYVRRLNNFGCNVIIFPYNTSKEDIMKYKPNALFISSGPGNPEELNEICKLIKKFIGKMPIFGIGLGMELIALSYGINTIKMTSGHHGSNYPVRNIQSNKIEITSQNHLYTIDKESFNNSNLIVTHLNVINNEIEGFYDELNKVKAIQFEPNVPIDENSEDLFKEFLNMIKVKGARKRG